MRKVAFRHRGAWGRLLRIPVQAERVWAWGIGPASGQPGWSLCSLLRLTPSSWERGAGGQHFWHEWEWG